MPSSQVGVFNVTQALVIDFPDEAASFTHDGVHWSEVNLIKAQVLLNDIATALPSARLRPAAPLLRRRYGKV